MLQHDGWHGGLYGHNLRLLGCHVALLRDGREHLRLELPEHVVRQHLRLCPNPLAEHAAGVPVGAQNLIDLLAETLCTRCLLYQFEEGIVDGSCLLTLMLGELGDLRGSRIGLRAGTRLIGLRCNGWST